MATSGSKSGMMRIIVNRKNRKQATIQVRVGEKGSGVVLAERTVNGNATPRKLRRRIAPAIAAAIATEGHGHRTLANDPVAAVKAAMLA